MGTLFENVKKVKIQPTLLEMDQTNFYKKKTLFSLFSVYYSNDGKELR
jgi:hypothetical protein